jgi:hypothetical protein
VGRERPVSVKPRADTENPSAGTETFGNAETRPLRAESDSFEALLRDVARVSLPAGAHPGLPVGASLAGGRLSVLRRIGEGGMGVVYEAYDSERRMRVALKTLNRLDAVGVYRLKNEFRAISDVDHPNLVKLYELFAEGDAWFFTMELVEGERFDRWVRRGGELDEGRLRSSLSQLSQALRAIHGAGKVDRDLKPSNVLVTSDGRVVVLDFGLAIDPEAGGIGQTLGEDSLSGTPAYMAPEQAAGRPATAESDYYALGVMLFEALTGKLPFTGSVGEILAAKQRDAAPQARSFVELVPADLDVLCSRLLSRDPSQRPAGESLGEQLRADDAPSSTTSGVRTARAERAALLGRETELRALRDGYLESLTGRPVVVVVAGESGMGKSALIEAFLSELRLDGSAVALTGRCHERENVPFKAFDALIDGLSRHLRRLPEPQAAALLPRDVFALARLFPVLNRVKVVTDAPTKDVPDPQELRRRAFAAFGELLGRIRDRGPLLVFIDDLQWTDQDSVLFIRHLLLHPEPVPLLLVLSHRTDPGVTNDLLKSVLEAASDNRILSLRTLNVGPLPAEATRVLAARLLGVPPSERVAEALAHEAQGNPFFATVLSRAMQSRAQGSPPPSLGEALEAHVASLPAGARRILSLMAYAGQPLLPAVLLDACGLEDGHAPLDLLRSEQLVRSAQATRAGRTVECYHDKIRELVADGLDAEDVSALARGLSRALEALPDPDPELLSRCLLAAGMPEKAAERAGHAAERALRALAFDRAARLYEFALRHGRFDFAEARRLRVARAGAFAQAGRGVAAALAYLAAREGAAGEEALELTRRAGEQYLLCGRLTRGRELLDEGLKPLGIAIPGGGAAAFASVTWSRLRLQAKALRFTPRNDQDRATAQRLEGLRNATHCFIRSDVIRAADLSARWCILALDSGHSVELARSLGWELMLSALIGDPRGRVDEMARLAEDLCESTGDPVAREWFHNGRGVFRSQGSGDLKAALSDFDRCLEVIATQPSAVSSYDRPWIEWQRGWLLLWLGRLSELSTLVQIQLEAAWARSDLTIIPAWTCLACFAFPAVGAHDRAVRELSRASLAWQADEVTMQDLFLLVGELVLEPYRGDALASWNITAPRRERMRGSLFARIAFNGVADGWCSGVGAAAALALDDRRARAEVLRTVRQYARRAERARFRVSPPSAPAVACAQGKPEVAIVALREAIAAPRTAPLFAHAAKRRLGVLLASAEGRALVQEADAFFTAGGVVDPASYVAALLPGVESP